MRKRSLRSLNVLSVRKTKGQLFWRDWGSPSSVPIKFLLFSSAEMAEAAALDTLYTASTTLVGVNSKLVKEGIDEFPAVCIHRPADMLFT